MMNTTPSVRFARRAMVLGGLALGLPFALSACADPKPLYVDQAWVRYSPSKDVPSAGYFTIHGGPADVQLRTVLTEQAVRVEMHETVKENGVSSMRPVQSVDVPAKTVVKFEPNGKHLMIWGLNPAVAASGKMQLTAVFSNGEKLIVDAVIRNMDGSAASGGGMAGMDHGNMTEMNMADMNMAGMDHGNMAH